METLVISAPREKEANAACLSSTVVTSPLIPNRIKPTSFSEKLCDKRMGCVDNTNLFESVAPYKPDPILGINRVFNEDTHDQKLNLGVGVYRGEDGKPFVLPVVAKVESVISSQYNVLGREYIPTEGLKSFCDCTATLLFGDSHQVIVDKRVGTVQTMSGTLAIYLAAESLKRLVNPTKTAVLLAQQTWVNHEAIFRDTDYTNIKYYRYWNRETRVLDFDGLCEDLIKADVGSIVVFQVCGQNPTGMDPTRSQWEKIGQIVKARKHIAMFDAAYHGICNGFDDDLFVVRHFATLGIDFWCAQSFSKNFTLYGERIGALHVVGKSSAIVENITRFLCTVARPIYSSPQIHAARIVSAILTDPELVSEWRQQVSEMSLRMKRVRSELGRLLQQQSVLDWSFIGKQTGIFCYTGLLPGQVKRMTSDFHIYLAPDGRVNLGSLSLHQVPYLVQALCEVTRKAA